MKTVLHLAFIVSLTLAACTGEKAGEKRDTSIDISLAADSTERIATFAGGCFWCTEAIFERVKGVNRVISGYSGGEEQKPSYEQVGAGKTHHAESIQVYYDSTLVSYPILLKVFFLGAHNPTQLNRQGPDVGKQYRSIAFYRNPKEKELIGSYIEQLDSSDHFDKPIVTQVRPFEKFWPAEAYHQDYYEHHPENPYVKQVSRPKVEKFKNKFPELLK